MLRGLILILVIASVAASGCASSGSNKEAEAGETPATASRMSTRAAWGPAAGTGAKPEAPSVPFRTYNASGHINADAHYLGIDPGTANAFIRVDIPKNATGMVAELKFSGTLSDFDLVVFSPKFCPDGAFPGGMADSIVCSLSHWATRNHPEAHRATRGGPNTSPGQLRLEFTPEVIAAACGEDACTWSSVAWWNLAANADYQLRVTVFYTIPVPKDFTAFV